MRLKPETLNELVMTVRQVAPDAGNIRLFGSRLDDCAKGGDIDLMVEFDHPLQRPAMTAARIAAQASRVVHGRAVDVVIKAPNLRMDSIHRLAEAEGILL